MPGARERKAPSRRAAGLAIAARRPRPISARWKPAGGTSCAIRGSSLGTLTVNGAISQKWRGPVGTTGGTGYIKNYNYDDRLRYQEPPQFLDPVEAAWHIQRETLDYP